MSPLQRRQYQNQRTRLLVVTKVIPKTKLSPRVQVAKQIDDVDPNLHSIPIPDSNREDSGADSDPDCKVRDFGFGLGSGGARYAQTGDGAQPQPDDELFSGGVVPSSYPADTAKNASRI